ncbi:MAG TPA: hypothetical protein DET40_11725 [Lentisphaeria bacterium]|nr:MAG: hypothetical protein A2X45_12570 [Lentisphaerae bacterium GWF2_50_93]HCE44207.1 hypothetical protein [Lentisphaeria bacterium]
MRNKIGIMALSMMLPLLQVQAAEPAPKPTFELPFEGNADASRAAGKAQPLKAENLSYADGVKGKAVFISKNSLLEYATEGNLKQESGTVTLWFKPNWRASEQSSDDRAGWHCLFSEPFPKGALGKDTRHGSGALWFWFWGAHFRGDVSDINDTYLVAGNQGLDKSKWAHVAMTWDAEKGHCIYMNGVPCGMPGDGNSPLNVKKGARDFSALRNKFASFFVGSQESEAKADGLIDELKIYDKALTTEQINSDMSLVTTLKLDSLCYYCIAGETVDVKWNLKNISAQDSNGACSWKVEDPQGATIAEGKETGASLKPGQSKQFVSKIKTAVKGEYKLVVDIGHGPAQYASIWSLGKTNPYLKEAGSKLDTRLIETIDLVRGVPPERFTSIGDCVKGALDGRTYFEAGKKKNDRFAVKLDLPAAGVPYVIEWDYPDDKLRTMELVGQDAKNPGNDYGLETGVFCGDEYPLSMKTLTHRSILWARAKSNALIFMTARAGAPAAVSEIRIYSMQGGLPDAGIKDAAPVGGWTRTVGIHFEDPSVGFDFGIERQLMPEYEETLDRLIAYMKWSGQNLLSYPAVWYHGKMGLRYQPRQHPDNFIACILAKFAANGLGFMPAINFQNIDVPEDVIINARTVSDGSLHNSPVMILSDGKPNPGGWHGSPPNFNPLHPAVQGYVDAQIDEMLELYSGSPAFKGITMHLTKHTIPWFGDLKAGYNDYNIDAFEKDTGRKVDVDRSKPLRGKLYYDWLMANARNEWIQWRCAKIADWYKAVAKRMAAKRPDLKLSLFSYNPTISDHSGDPRFKQPDFADLIDKESGIDSKLYAGIPNIILAQTIYPSDYRQMAGVSWLAAALPVVRDDYKKPAVYSMLNDASFPWINMHDRYFEDAVGRAGKWWGGEGNPLKASWLTETGWRVSTLNPNINSFLEHFVMPLKYNDIMGFTKGGYLIGTCGVEEKLAEFSKAYRILPAKKFTDLAGSTETVKSRALTMPDGTWFYAVNTGKDPSSVSFVFDRAPGTVSDLGAGQEQKVSDAKFKVELKPYQLRSFKASKDIAVKSVE